MHCSDPVVLTGAVGFPCGRCLPCLINRKRIWSNRILLESTLHANSSFVTLTYSDDNLPKIKMVDGGPALLNLSPLDLKNFLKRVRTYLAPMRVRFFAVGEYGHEGAREFNPHYHLVLFGYACCVHGRSRYKFQSSSKLVLHRRTCCVQCDTLRDLWGLGNIETGPLDASTAAYITGYTTKKMTHRDDTRLEGREPEFARMSLKPGIGRDFMWDYASAYIQNKFDARTHDVPAVTGHANRKAMPIGRYLRRALREMIGRETKGIPDAEAVQEMLALLQASVLNERSFKEEIKAKHEAKVASIAGRFKIYKQRKNL